ncbi:MAG: MerR family transcriptional regulator [Candidatus Desulfovibrio faecigallinarum]|nr:MerR family transcriptional regulator [Candidatus Desulfovibrio faecigallinarum]
MCHSTKDTLRHDELGLLKPQHAGKNGYRYYNAKQFLQFEMIRFLKEKGPWTGQYSPPASMDGGTTKSPA